MKISFQNMKKSIQFSLQDDSSVLTRFDQKYGITPSLKKILFTKKKKKKKKKKKIFLVLRKVLKNQGLALGWSFAEKSSLFSKLNFLKDFDYGGRDLVYKTSKRNFSIMKKNVKTSKLIKPLYKLDTDQESR